MRYAIVVEKVGATFSAYAPDLPGCIATGATLDEVRQAIGEAIRFHLEGLRADEELVPAPITVPDASQSRSKMMAEEPFTVFSEWAGEVDEAAYANL